MVNETIRKRKSIRKYDPEPLGDTAIAQVLDQIAGVSPLYPGIRFSIGITGKVRGIFGLSAPHYLTFHSEEGDGAYENIGFIGQQMDLFFSGSGIGSCWLGMAKPPDNANNDMPFVIGMAFGNPAEPLHRAEPDFKRKPLSAISEGDDGRLEAARLAPSGMNAQNWFFVAQGGKIHCYRKKTILALGGARLGCIDMGIAICHIAKESSEFSFIKETGMPGRKGFIYTGTVA